MGVVNVTPDSFSDGGRFEYVDRAVAHGLDMVRQGAAIIDVGGESTRPGAERVPDATELDRVLPVVRQLAAEGVCVSIDTMRSTTARACVRAGAGIINDVSGGLADPDMLGVAAEHAGPYVIMHWRAHSARMRDWAQYADVVADVIAELGDRVADATRAGVAQQAIVLDPGLGFAKDSEHNWALLRALPRLREMGHPVLIGASRKRFLGELLATDGVPRPVAEREIATATVSVLAAAAGAWCVRVHDVRATADALAVARAWPGAWPGGRRPGMG